LLLRRRLYFHLDVINCFLSSNSAGGEKSQKHKGGITMKINLSSFLQGRLNIFMCRMLGWRITFFYMSILGKLYFFFNRKEKWKIKKAVKTVFIGRKNRSEIRSITRDVFRGILFHYYEKLFNAYSTTETWKAFFRTHIENQGITSINQALSKGKGVLLITGHLGGG